MLQSIGTETSCSEELWDISPKIDTLADARPSTNRRSNIIGPATVGNTSHLATCDLRLGSRSRVGDIMTTRIRDDAIMEFPLERRDNRPPGSLIRAGSLIRTPIGSTNPPGIHVLVAYQSAV